MIEKAGVVDVFSVPYERWSTRNTSIEEALRLVNECGVSPSDALCVHDELLETVSTPAEAASYILRHGADNGLESHIDDALRSSTEYSTLRALMPSRVPPALASYQSHFSESIIADTDIAINLYGTHLSPGQPLFHGGHWVSPERTLTTTRPFSTSFCPQVAFVGR